MSARKIPKTPSVLAQWVDEECARRNVPAYVIAKEVGLSPAGLYRVRDGSRMPSWPTMEKLLKASKGRVTPNSFVRKWPKGMPPITYSSSP